MKQFIYMLVFCLIGFTGMSKGVETEKQLRPPELGCIDFDIGINSLAIESQVFIVDYCLPLIAVVPELAVNFADCSTYVLPEAVIKPPGTLAEIQETTTKSYFKSARDWVTHRSHLSKKTTFLLNNYVISPNEFD